MEMARIANRLTPADPRPRIMTKSTTTKSTTATTPLALVLCALALGAGAGVGCGKQVCPDGMRVDNARSKPGINAFCESTSDKTRAAFVELHKGGARRQICPFVGGHPAGLYQAFHPDGSRWLEGRYENGRKIGRWTQWAPDGRKVADGEYRDGLMIEGAPVGFPAVCETIAW
jgi:hypothetical protein